MLFKKHQFILIALLFATGAHFTPIPYGRNVRLTARDLIRRVRKIDPSKSNIEILKNVDFSKIFKELHQKLSPDEVRIVTTLGLVSGTLRAEESMREHLYVMIDDLLTSFNAKKPKENMDKLIKIEETINRDKSMVRVMNSMLKYAHNATTLDALQNEMLEILKTNDNESKRLESKKIEMNDELGADLRPHMKDRLYEIREMIDGHIEQIHTSLTENAKRTIKFIQALQTNNKNARHRPNNTKNVKLDPSLFVVRRLWDQVASASQLPDANDFDVAINYQPRNSRSEVKKEQKKKTESKDAKKEEKVKIRLTKGEEVEFLTGIDTNENSERSKSAERSDTNHQSAPSPAVKLIRVDAKLERFKRKTATVNSKLDLEPFILDVDIDIDEKADTDDAEDEKSKLKSRKKTDAKLKKRKDTPDDADNPDEVANDNEVDGFGDDEHKKENQGQYLPLQGGLAGLIGQLSGGPGGSDIGAVVAALSAVIGNVLGPGGIDIQGIAGTGTALLAGLIGGDENFGRVLANIVGVSIDGFSGGGGADKNGEFFGQFIGRLISILSADPEDPDDNPIRPAIFIENLYHGIAKGSAKKPNPDEEGEDEKAGLNKEPNFGSDSGGFLQGVLGGIFSVFTSASTSASAGSSQHSASSSTDSSGASSQQSSGSSAQSSSGPSSNPSGSSSGSSSDSSSGSSGHKEVKNDEEKSE